MRVAAEVLRWVLVGLQVWLVGWMLWTGLWKKLPAWTTWLACEALSRAMFNPGGNYWHKIWLPLQPTLMFLLVASAVEARWQAGRRPALSMAGALAIVPLGLTLDLHGMIVLRGWLTAGVAGSLVLADGAPTVKGHARILALIAGSMALLNWLPTTPETWWTMRVAFLAIYVGACLGWTWVFSSGDRGSSTNG